MVSSINYSVRLGMSGDTEGKAMFDQVKNNEDHETATENDVCEETRSKGGICGFHNSLVYGRIERLTCVDSLSLGDCGGPIISSSNNIVAPPTTRLLIQGYAPMSGLVVLHFLHSSPPLSMIILPRIEFQQTIQTTKSRMTYLTHSTKLNRDD